MILSVYRYLQDALRKLNALLSYDNTIVVTIPYAKQLLFVRL